jgi:hypothetical protein
VIETKGITQVWWPVRALDMGDEELAPEREAAGFFALEKTRLPMELKKGRVAAFVAQ